MSYTKYKNNAYSILLRACEEINVEHFALLLHHIQIRNITLCFLPLPQFNYTHCLSSLDRNRDQ